ncbi:hypothetical protein SEA_HANK144_42 [Streptomyces phage Hank144]|uniref:Uncharacterized protein n=1 Tax=Streptomyces phage Hank144 TaxID=2301573 RepID=A0A385DQH9_9CAUD|nr:hypothetical protein KGG76_gp42 [Streptomyces phage Hank144]AXQ61097.1 hypothetical protein SEA_HANK144_42 [Streptomyces phage Hank144]
MAENEITETKPTPRKKAPARKPDPMALLVAEAKEAVSQLGPLPKAGTPDHRRKHHDGRAAAWAKQYAHEGTSDSLLLSLAFEVGACYPQEERHALLQLAGAALALADRLDGDK